METLKFLFRSGFILIMVGVVGTLLFQFFFTSNTERGALKTTGPAEQVGEVVDRGISTLGKITERAGQKMQQATTLTERQDSGTTAKQKDEVVVREKADKPERAHEGRSLVDILNQPPPHVGASGDN